MASQTSFNFFQVIIYLLLNVKPIIGLIAQHKVLLDVGKHFIQHQHNTIRTQCQMSSSNVLHLFSFVGATFKHFLV
jgi:hypothetical protein